MPEEALHTSRDSVHGRSMLTNIGWWPARCALLPRPDARLRIAGRILARAFAAQQRPTGGQRSGEAAMVLSQLRLIGDDGSQLGVMPPKEALAIANERSLVLMEVARAADPPVWKLMAAADLEEAKPEPTSRQRDRRTKAAKPPKEKEVRLTDSISPRDAEHKIETALKFLDKGHVVRVLVLNQGKPDPEVSGKALAVSLVESVCAACEEVAKVGHIQGNTSLRAEGETKLTRQFLGPVFATLVPKEGAFRNPPTPREPPKGKAAGRGRGRGRDGDEGS